MNIHLQTGPGHHEMILIRELISRRVDFTYSRYYPKYTFERFKAGENISQDSSALFNRLRWLVYGISNRLKSLRDQNAQLDYIYPAYDHVSVSRIPSDTNLVFGWAQVSLKALRYARRKGIIGVLDYPIPHISSWQKMLKEEAKLLGLRSTRSLFTDTMEKRMLAEIDQADFISVPSEFVYNSFIENGVPAQKLIFNSYGIDTDFFKPGENKPRGKQLNIIFVGSVELRKGVHYLLEAVDRMGDDTVQLNLIGTVYDDIAPICEKYRSHKNIHWLGQQNRDQIAKLMREADVLVMPSLLEGLSLTVLEAMASGTAVISSTNAGGVDLIKDYQEGFIVPVRDPNAIAEKLKWMRDHPGELAPMGECARKKVVSHYKMSDYADRFVDKILSKGK